MNIRVQFFSRLRAIGGDSILERHWEPGTTVADAVAALEKEFPALAKWEGKLLIAIGLEFAGREQILQNGDLLSLMPPVQGG